MGTAASFGADAKGPSSVKKQFGTYDTLEDRRTIMQLLVRLGDGLPEQLGNKRRARFLQSLIGGSDNGFAEKELKVTPCDAVRAYHLFVAITGCLGVDIDVAAQRLETMIRD